MYPPKYKNPNDPFAPAEIDDGQQQQSVTGNSMIDNVIRPGPSSGQPATPEAYGDQQPPTKYYGNGMPSNLTSLLGLKQGQPTAAQYAKEHPGSTLRDYKAEYPDAQFAGSAPAGPTEDPRDPSTWEQQSTDLDAPIRGTVNSSGGSLAKRKMLEEKSARNRAADLARKQEEMPIIDQIRARDPNWQAGRDMEQRMNASSTLPGPISNAISGGQRGPGYIAINGGVQRPLNFQERMAQLKAELEQQGIKQKGIIEAAKETGREKRNETNYNRALNVAKEQAAAQRYKADMTSSNRNASMSARHIAAIDQEMNRQQKVIDETNSVASELSNVPSSWTPEDRKKYDLAKQRLRQAQATWQRLQKAKDAINSGVPVDPEHIRDLTGGGSFDTDAKMAAAVSAVEQEKESQKPTFNPDEY